jgi:Ca2+-binding RTX toxin-like protein
MTVIFNVGAATQITTSSVQKNAPTITTLSDGGWVVTWYASDASNDGIWQQRFNSSGVSVGGETLVNAAFQTNFQQLPQVTALTGGGWVVTWQSLNQDGSGWGTYQRQFSSVGVGGSIVKVNTTVTGDQLDPVVAGTADGGWVVAWTGPDKGSTGVYYQAYNAGGMTSGGESSVAVNFSANEENASVAGLVDTAADPDDGGFVVVWQGQDGAGWGVYQRRYVPGLGFEAPELVAQTTALDQLNATVTGLADGGWVVSWLNVDNLRVVQRRYDKDGEALTGEVNVGTAGSSTAAPKVTALADGGWVVAWEGKLSYFSSTGDSAGSSASLPTGSLAKTSDGGFVSTWSADPNPSDAIAETQVFTQKYTVTGGMTAGADLVFGGSGNDTVAVTANLLGAGDRLYGGLETDSITFNGTVLWSNAATIVGFEKIQGLDFDDTFQIAGSDIAALPLPVDGGLGNDTFSITGGGSVSLVGKTITGFEKIDLTSSSGTTLTTDSKALALTVWGEASGLDKVTLSGTTLTLAERGQVFQHGIETVQDASGTYTNSAPTGISITKQTIAENSGSGTTVGVLTATDPNLPGNDVMTFALLDDAGGRFKIVGNQIQVAAGAQLDYESKTSHTVKVQVTDIGGRTFPTDITISVTNVNESPTEIFFTSGGVVNESAPLNSVVANLGATDPDGDTSLTFKLIDNNGNAVDSFGAFKIVGKQLQVNNPSLLDYETSPGGAAVAVNVTDGKGGSFTQTLNVAILNVNEAPQAATFSSGGSVNENAIAGTVIGQLSSSDPEGGGVTFKLVDGGGNAVDSFGAFWISGNQLKVNTGAVIDHEATPNQTLKIRASDGTNFTDSFLQVQINNVNEAPTGLTIVSGGSVRENDPTGEVVATLAGIDPDSGDQLTYEIVGGGPFIIDGNQIKVANGSLLNYEIQDDYLVSVKVIDSGAVPLSTTFSIPITVDDVNDFVTGTVTISGTPEQGKSLTASNTLADEDGLGPIGYQWLRNGEEITGGIGSIYTLTQADVGKVINVKAFYTDGAGNFETKTSAATDPVLDANVAPKLTGTQAKLNDAVEDTLYQIQASDLLAGYSDGDDDTMSVSNLQSSTGTLTDSGQGFYTFKPNDNFHGTVTLTYNVIDGKTGSVTANQNFKVLSVNDQPTGSVQIAGTAAEGQTLTASNTIADADGFNPAAVLYQWQRDGDDIQGATGGNYLLTATDAGKKITVLAKYIDGDGTAEAVVSSPTATVVGAGGNLAPQLTGQKANLVAGTEDISYTISATDLLAGYSDPDGGTIAIANLAASSGTLINNGNGTFTLTPAQDFNGKVNLTYSVQDGQGGSTQATQSFVLAAVNDLPTGVVGISGTPTQGQTLTASNTLADVDGLGTVTYQWLREGQTISGATGAAYTLKQADVGAKISVKASYTDGGGTSESVTSADTAAVADANVSPQLTGSTAVLPGGTEGVPYTITAASLLAGFTDDDSDPMSIINLQATNGTLVDNGNGTWSFTATDPDFNGTVALTYQVSDGQGGTASGAQSFVLAPVNDAPTGSVTLSGTAQVDQVLQANTNTLADVDGLGTLSYKWFRGATEIGGATQASYTLTAADVGAQISVQVSYQDNGGTTETVTSNLTGAVQPLGGTPPQNGGSGDDNLDGDDGDDTVNGGGGNDTASGDDGDDTVNGDDGDDTVNGGSGDDTLGGGAGNDTINGNDGNDTSNGGGDDDTIDGGDGNDQIDGGDGDDIIDGGAGDDTIQGGAGDDTVNGGVGNDQIDGGTGNDTVNGGDGNDVLAGGDDDDTLDGGSGDDTLSGGGGDDTLTGGSGNDQIDGGAGSDTLDYSAGDGPNGVTVIFTSPGAGVAIDTYGNTDTFTGIETVIGTNKADTMMGNNGNETLVGGDGDDVLTGGSGNDILNGGLGNDKLDGGLGDDILIAGGGADTLIGGGGTDTAIIAGDASLTTFTGIENIAGSDAADTLRLDGEAFSSLMSLNGGVGADTLLLGSGTFDFAKPGLAITGIEQTTLTANNTVLVFDGSADVAEALAIGGVTGKTGTIAAFKSGGLSTAQVNTLQNHGYTVLQGSVAADTPSVAPVTVAEDGTVELVISRSILDGSELTHYKISGITNGQLFADAGMTQPITNGTFIASAGPETKLYFKPSANFAGQASVTVQGSLSNTDAGLGGGAVNGMITVASAADTPSIAPVTVAEDGSTAVVITRNAADGADITHYKIGGIVAGKLYADAAMEQEITNGSFVQSAGLNTTLFFKPNDDFFGNASFTAQASLSNMDTGLGGDAASAAVTVTPVLEAPVISQQIDVEDAEKVTVTIASDSLDSVLFNSPAVTHYKISGITGGTFYTDAALTQAVTDGGFVAAAASSILTTLYFKPNADFAGNATFTVQASVSNTDAGVGAEVANGVITLTPVDDLPIAGAADLGTVEEDKSRSITAAQILASANAIDIDGPDLAVTNLVIASGKGTLTANPDNTWTYTGAPDDESAVTFTYTLAGGVTGTATLDITPVPDAPKDLALTGTAVRELSGNGFEIGTLSAVDPDVGAALTYELVGHTAGLFAIGGANKDKLVVADGFKLDFEQKQSHTVKVKVKVSDGTLFQEKEFTITVTDWLSENTSGTAGNDVFWGGAATDRLSGGLGNDQLKGGGGADTLNGGGGKDQLWGGLGKDTLTGGAGNDVFVFDTKLSKANIDRISDFANKTGNNDSIWLENSIMTKLGSGTLAKPVKLKADAFWVGDKAHDASDRVIYNKATGALFYDQDGTGSKGAVQIATLNKNLILTNADFFVI